MKDPIYHATQLAEYGIYGAGGDDGEPLELDWGADCVEAAVLLWKNTSSAVVSDPPDKLAVCGDLWTEEELLEKVRELRQKAEELRNAAK